MSLSLLADRIVASFIGHRPQNVVSDKVPHCLLMEYSIKLAILKLEMDSYILIRIVESIQQKWVKTTCSSYFLSLVYRNLFKMFVLH